ncbi:LOW QUALITY PROTEIN: uncharacterized protein LOC135335987 [Halichondria panicea]|uniref:LOW QUALITY PROTEIN: uncharacterized protein LOC135335987 n=1 Tax=Halichondria panicea TaxID=6063 RepID=UPI00312B425B
MLIVCVFITVSLGLLTHSSRATQLPTGISNRFDSFAPVRDGPNEVKWLVDGKDYVSEVADGINNATYEVLITGWEFCYNLSLKRSNSNNATEEWRLDMLLKKKAMEGVQIYILLYNDPIDVLKLGNKDANVLVNANITVLHHPHDWFRNTVRWSHHEKLVVIDRGLAFVGGIDLALRRWDTSNHRLTDKDFPNSSRLPWHDASCMFNGEPALDVANHFIQRLNAIRTRHKLPEHRPNVIHRIQNPSTRNSKIQVVRSATSWSANQRLENSILKAYLHAINVSNHSIYIENQFFVGPQDDTTIKNTIQKSLVDRIVRADENNEDFHVMVVLPLKSDLPGEFCELSNLSSPNFLELQTQKIYFTLFKGVKSLFGKLIVKNVSVEKYISVYGLRTYDLINDILTTEQIYVHSKVIIVDDRLTIIGSANINDRSMLGYRDSEVDVIIEDQEMIVVKMNGNSHKVGEFSHSLRCHLIKEHLGILKGLHVDIDVSDPISQHFRKSLTKIAARNTQI